MTRTLLILTVAVLTAAGLKADETRRIITTGVNKPGEYQLPVKDGTLSTLLEWAGGVNATYTEDAFVLVPQKGAPQETFRIKLSKLYGHDEDYALPDGASVHISECNYFGGMSAEDYQALEKVRAGYLARKQEGKIITVALETLKVKQPASDLPASLQGSPNLPFAVPTPQAAP